MSWSFDWVSFALGGISSGLTLLASNRRRENGCGDAIERRQKSKVKQLRLGDRVRVIDKTGVDFGTITRVEKSGENFDVKWDVDGQTNTLRHFDYEHFELVK
jgi:hypothetical protein